MKILIGYDGSDCSEAALDDLKMAGLPEDDTEAVVMSVADVWIPPENTESNGDQTKNRYFEKMAERQKAKAEKEVAEAEAFARHAKERLRKNFPAWKIESKATFGSPAWEILTKAEEIKADLIVVGSHGRTALGRFILGSISQKILTEAHCSVRVARGRIEIEPSHSRIVIGFDGSDGANAAVEAVAARNWVKPCEIRLVTVTNHIAPTAIGRFIPPVVNWVEEELQTEREWIEKLAEKCLKTLRATGNDANLSVHAGNPKTFLVEEAERWHADSIFVGANAFGSRVERFLLGSVSAAAAARAHCSVEIIRKGENDN